MVNRIAIVPKLPLCLLLAWLPGFVGCHQGATNTAAGAGTTSNIVLPETDPPVLTQFVGERIKAGMGQDEVLIVLQDAANDRPAAKSLVDAAAVQSKLNNLRFDLTITQGQRKLVLGFENKKLIHVQRIGLE